MEDNRATDRSIIGKGHTDILSFSVYLRVVGEDNVCYESYLLLEYGTLMYSCLARGRHCAENLYPQLIAKWPLR